MKPHTLRLIALLMLALPALALVARCAPGAGAGPSTWIDRPLDGDQVALEPLTIEAHASDVDGVARIEFFVDDSSIGAVPTDDGRFVEAKAGWSPTAPGTHTIRASGVDLQGNRGVSMTARVVVIGFKATDTPTVALTGETAVPPALATLVPSPFVNPSGIPSDTPVLSTLPPPPTEPAAATGTFTPQPPSSTPPPVCPGAPVIDYFTANPATITAGQSSTLRWGAVSNATSASIDPDLGGIPTPGSTTVSPGSTTTYTLTATGCGGTTRKQVTVLVKNPSPTPRPPTRTPAPPPPDTTPPTISGLSANPTKIWVVSSGCASNPQYTTISVRVSDPSGVQTVVASWSLAGPSGQTGMNSAGGNLYQANIGGFNSSGTLSISVTATDAANNSSQAGPITVTVAPCIQ